MSSYWVTHHNVARQKLLQLASVWQSYWKIKVACLLRQSVIVTYAGGNACWYIVTTQTPPSPMLCCSATLAPFTWRLPASPLSCQHSSAHWAKPANNTNNTVRGHRFVSFFKKWQAQHTKQIKCKSRLDEKHIDITMQCRYKHAL